jgi:hypothetical protein
MSCVPERIKESGKSSGDRQLVLVGNEELGGQPVPKEVLQLVKRYPLRIAAGSKRVPGCSGVQCPRRFLPAEHGTHLACREFYRHFLRVTASHSATAAPGSTSRPPVGFLLVLPPSLQSPHHELQL